MLVLAALVAITLALAYDRAAVALLGVILGTAALALIFLLLPWAILWPRNARPALGAYLAAFARGRPMTPPGAASRR